MTIALENQSNARQDPAYRQAMAYLQEGEWQRAINAFEMLQRQYPGNVQIARALDEARFKAGIDDQTQVKAKRWAGGRRLRLMPIVLLVILVVGGYQAVQIYETQIKPAIDGARRGVELDNMLTQALAFLDAGRLDDAQDLLQSYLDARPDDAEAQAALVRLEERQMLATDYEAGVQAEVVGDYPTALEAFTNIIMVAPDYGDVKLRITRIKQRMTINDLLTQANTLFDMGAKAEAAGYYRQIQDLDNNFERVYITEQLFTIYYDLGIAELEQPSIQIEQVRNALDRFQEALQQQPSNRDALQQQRLARTYLTARERYDDRDWHDAVRRLRDIYELDADYLGNTVVQLLYDAYIGSGDLYRADDDLYLAYDQYSKAAALPGVDTVVARGRIFEIQPFLTPTSTPTITPTPSDTPTITPVPPTAAPTPTPTPRAFSNFRGRIVFQSDNEEQPGYWVMNADGTNREYLGEGDFYDNEYEKTIEQHQFSPDGRYRVFVDTKAWDKDSQVYVARPVHPEFGELPDRAISQLTGVSYDPVWSPDGGRIAFVSQENESDDIWIANADGTDRRALMRNPWEWDKSPTWSPDSQRLAFWSNRTGTKQIFVMDANGQNVRNISNVPWDEYNPVWIR